VRKVEVLCHFLKLTALKAQSLTLAQTLAQTGIYQLVAYSKHERQGGPVLNC
jgi:hypothetical protein